MYFKFTLLTSDKFFFRERIYIYMYAVTTKIGNFKWTTLHVHTLAFLTRVRLVGVPRPNLHNYCTIMRDNELVKVWNSEDKVLNNTFREYFPFAL